MLQQLLLPCGSSPPPRSPWLPPPRTTWRSPHLKFPPRPRRSATSGFKAAAAPGPPPNKVAAVGAAAGEEDPLPATPALLPNALRRQRDPTWRGGFSLGVDLGDSRTGLALGKGFAPPRTLEVLELRGQKLELRLLEIAKREEVNEFIVGLPRSWDGKETPQSNKVRSIAGRLAIRAAERGWRTYLQDEHGTTVEALDYMINLGHKKSARQQKMDSYSAMPELQETLKRGPWRDTDF